MPQSPTEIKLTVLAVDDEAMNNDLVRRTLRLRPGLRVLLAASGKEALEIVAREKVDVILVDQSMPGMSGMEFLTAAANAAHLQSAIVIVVTGYPELDEVVQAMNQGLVSHVVVKPWTPEDLLTAIDRVTAIKDMHAAVGKLNARFPRKT